MISPYFTLAIVLLAAGMAVTAAVVYLAARSILRPPRMTDGKAIYVLNRLTPRDVGLSYESKSYVVHDELTGGKLTLAGWWMPTKGGKSKKTVILVHGYADAKVGALAWAPVWAELGFNLFAIDLRAHGQSEGTLCTGGFYERHDLAQVVGQLVAAEPSACQLLYLFGASLGAAVVAGAAEILTSSESTISELSAPPILAGIVLDSPFADFRSACTAHLQRFGLPGGWLINRVLSLAGRLANADFSAVRPIDQVRRIRCPTLILAAGDDPYLTEAESAAWSQIAEANPLTRYRRFEEVAHLMGVIAAAEAYRQAVADFVGFSSGPPI